MVKLVRCLKRRKELTLEQFKAYWLDEHAKLEKMVMEKTPTKKIVATFATGEIAIGSPSAKMVLAKEPLFDGMVELYYESIEDLKEAFAGEIPAIMRKDEENFVDLSGAPVRAVTEEYVPAERMPQKLIEGRFKIKTVRFVRRRKDLTLEQFKAYWLDEHAKLEKMVVEKTPIWKIVASFATGEMIGGTEPPFDGMVELYFESIEGMRELWGGEIPATMRKDEENFVDLSEEPVRVVTEEYLPTERTT